MLRTFALRAFVGTAITVAALSASAATMTLNDWTFGNGNSVHASDPAYRGPAGGFAGTLSGSGGLNLDGPIDAYCVELTESFSFGRVYADYQVMTATDYFGATKATALGKLISYVLGGNLFDATAVGYKDDLSTSLQLAIWNVVYDADTSLSGGVFRDSSPYRNGNANFLGANDLFANSANQGITYDLYVLSSGRPIAAEGGNQDQLIWRARPQIALSSNDVPEPASAALVAAALAGLALMRRRPA